MINISAATPVWLLADFLQLLAIVIDQLERSAYWLTSYKPTALISYSGVTMIRSSTDVGREEDV